MKTSLVKKVCAVFASLCIVMQSGFLVNAARKVTLIVEDEEISYWTPCTDTLKLVTDSADDAEISLYDLGSSILYESKVKCKLDAIAEDDGYLLDLVESLIEGHRYQLVVDDIEIFFKATTKGGKAEITDRIEFSGITSDELNNATDSKPEKNTYVMGSDGLLITKNANETRVSIKEDDAFCGGKGLQFSGRGTLDKEIITGALIQEGKIKVEARVKVVSGSFEMSMGNSNGALVPLLKIEPNSSEISYQDTATTSGIKTRNVASPVDGFAEISYEMNLDDKSVVYTINGEEGTLGTGEMPYYNIKGDISTYGVGFIQLESSSKTGEYILDFIKTTTYADAPDAEKITLVDVEGKTVKTDENGEISPNIKEIRIKFNSDMDEEILSNINILDSDGIEVLTEGEYDAHTRIYSLALPQYLEQFGEYMLCIPQAETGLVYGYMESFETGEGTIAIAGFNITDISGKTIHDISDITDGVTLNLEIINTKLAEGKMTIVCTESCDKLMTNMICKEVEISKDERKINSFLNVNIEDVSKINEIKGFVWNNVKEHIPQHNALTLY